MFLLHFNLSALPFSSASAVAGRNGFREMRRSASSASLATLSGHSADGDVGQAEDDSEQDRSTPAVAEHGTALPAKGANGRTVLNAYAARSDVGSIGILTGNWGGSKSNRDLQKHVNDDLRKGPASIVMLQEAHLETVVGALSSPSVEGVSDARRVLDRRPGYQYSCIHGTEDGNTLLVAARRRFSY